MKLQTACATVICLALALGVSTVAIAETAYVSSRQARVYQDAGFDSALLANLKLNDEIEILEREGIWLQIRTPAVTGWVSQYSVTSQRPLAQKVSILTRLKNFFIGNKKRDRLSLVSTAGGIRGLTEDESDELGKTDFSAVREIESIEITESDIDRFVEERQN